MMSDRYTKKCVMAKNVLLSIRIVASLKVFEWERRTCDGMSIPATVSNCSNIRCCICAYFIKCSAWMISMRFLFILLHFCFFLLWFLGYSFWYILPQLTQCTCVHGLWHECFLWQKKILLFSSHQIWSLIYSQNSLKKSFLYGRYLFNQHHMTGKLRFNYTENGINIHSMLKISSNHKIHPCDTVHSSSSTVTAQR